jgi:hypothetical protein
MTLSQRIQALARAGVTVGLTRERAAVLVEAENKRFEWVRMRRESDRHLLRRAVVRAELELVT